MEKKKSKKTKIEDILWTYEYMIKEYSAASFIYTVSNKISELFKEKDES